MREEIKVQLIEKLRLPEDSTRQVIEDELTCRFAEYLDLYADHQEAFDMLDDALEIRSSKFDKIIDVL